MFREIGQVHEDMNEPQINEIDSDIVIVKVDVCLGKKEKGEGSPLENVHT